MQDETCRVIIRWRHASDASLRHCSMPPWRRFWTFSETAPHGHSPVARAARCPTRRTFLTPYLLAQRGGLHDLSCAGSGHPF